MPLLAHPQLLSLTNLRTVWYSNVAHLAFLEVSTPRKLHLHNEKRRTLRYRAVMRDQRCVYPKLDTLSSSQPTAYSDQFKL